jgi:hypothetical protein
MSLSKFNQTPSKPWAVSDFKLYRSNIANFVDTHIVPLIDHSNNKIRRICIHGEVKSGKREIVEYSARLDYGNNMRKHIFISSFHRVADDPQRIELRNHNIAVHSIINDESIRKALDYIRENLEENVEIIIHYDECDYGSGDKQQLAKIYKNLKDEKLITSILYSATPEELLYSSDVDDEEFSLVRDCYELGVSVKFIPPETYCGAKKFLDENLVFDAKPFIIKKDGRWDLSSQAREIILNAKAELKKRTREHHHLMDHLFTAEDNNNSHDILKYTELINNFKFKNVIVVRLSYKDNLSKSKIDKIFMDNFATFNIENTDITYDKENKGSHSIKWSDEIYWNKLRHDRLQIFIYDQTSTRSTEWAFHDRLFATHDYRPTITYNTIVQAQLRVAHYSTKYGGFQHIKVYGHKKSFEYAAKRISLEDYFENDIEKVKFSYNNIKVGQLLSFTINDTQKRKGTVECFQNRKYIVSCRGNIIQVNKSQINIEKDKYMICDSNGNINEEFNDIYDKTTCDVIMRDELGFAEVSKLHSRVTGRSKEVLKIFSKFIPCNKLNINEMVTQEIKNCENLEDGTEIPTKVRNYGFKLNKYFDESTMTNGEEIYFGTLRAARRKYDYDELKISRWGFNENNINPRLTVCYDNENNLGLCLRFVTEETEIIDNLQVRLSMYQS